jgi:hypothetical protein
MNSTKVKLNSPEIDPTFLCQGSTQPQSRNSAYSSSRISWHANTKSLCAESKTEWTNNTKNTQTSEGSKELSGNAKTYIDQLQKENQQLKNLFLVAAGTDRKKCEL